MDLVSAGAAETGQPWWVDFFGELYAEADIEFRDRDLTAAMVACVRRLAPPDKHPRLLDLACGQGRHAVPLAAAGYRVSAVDLAPGYLSRARDLAAAAGQEVDFVRGDMRDLGAFADGSFDVVTSLHTSFGFFPDAADDQRVIDEVRRVLAPGGLLIIDVLNRDAFLRQTSELLGVQRGQFVVRNYFPSAGRLFLHEEVFDPLTSRIRWTVTDAADATRTTVADYRIFSAHEVLALVRAAGLRPEAVYGDFSLSPFTAHASNVICVASVAK
jgi:SAM-dependent methyltransferase